MKTPEIGDYIQFVGKKDHNYVKKGSVGKIIKIHRDNIAFSDDDDLIKYVVDSDTKFYWYHNCVKYITEKEALIEMIKQDYNNG